MTKSQPLLKLVTLTLMLLTFVGATAKAGAPDYSIHEDYLSPRALGMGNAFTAVVDDHNAIFYNPAALGKKKDTDVRLFLRGAADKDVYSFYNDVKTAGKDPNALDSAFNKYYGEDMAFRLPTLGGIIARPRWSLAIIPADFSADFNLHRSVAASAFVNAYLDTTVAFGHGDKARIPNTHKFIYWGFNIKAIHRAYYSDVIQSAQLATSDTKLLNIDRAQEGATVDGDIGLLYDQSQGMDEDGLVRASYALVVRNVGDYGFPIKARFINHDALPPPRLQRRLDLGSKLSLRHFWVFDPKIAVDVRNIGDTNWSPLKGIHAGAELYWKMFNWWKGHWSAGLNEGYWTAGFGARLGIFQLDLASWGEEVGTTDARQESRRYMLETSLDF